MYPFERLTIPLVPTTSTNAGVVIPVLVGSAQSPQDYIDAGPRGSLSFDLAAATEDVDVLVKVSNIRPAQTSDILTWSTLATIEPTTTTRDQHQIDVTGFAFYALVADSAVDDSHGVVTGVACLKHAT